MRRRLALITSIAAAAILLTGVVATGQAKKTVSVGDDFFNPDKLSISTGTKVAFDWIGSDKHNVVKAKGPGSSFASESTSQQGVNLTHKFKKAGTYRIICTIHDKMKMKIEVG